MADSPWNKRFLTKQKIPAAANQPAQLPTAATPIQINLSGTTLAFENADVGALSAEAGEEIKKLREEILDLKERNNMLEFKIELLIDMLAVREADIEVLKSNEAKYQEKLRQLSSRNLEAKKKPKA